MKILKTFLFLIVLMIIYVLTFSWVNLWVPKNKIGVFYLDDYAKAEIVSQNVFTKDFFKNLTWNWKRAFPHRTTLFLLTKNILIQEQDLSFDLPNAAYYAGILSVSPETFRSTVTIKTTYRINPDTIKAYLDGYYIDNIPSTEENIIANLSHQIEHAISKNAQEEIFNSLKTALQSNLNQESWDASIFSILKNSINNALRDLPITIQDIVLQTIQAPDIPTYAYITNASATFNTPQSSTDSADNEFSKNSLWLQQYINFIRELGAVTKDNPSTLEIIKILPPNVLKESFEK